MKKTIKKLTSIILASLMIVSMLPSLTITSDAEGGPDTPIEEVDIWLEHSNGVIPAGWYTEVATGETDEYNVETSNGYYEDTDCSVSTQDMTIGNYYYAKVTITPKSGYTFDSKPEIYVDGFLYDENHSNYGLESVVNGSSYEVVLKFKCVDVIYCTPFTELVLPNSGVSSTSYFGKYKNNCSGILNYYKEDDESYPEASCSITDVHFYSADEFENELTSFTGSEECIIKVTYDVSSFTGDASDVLNAYLSDSDNKGIAFSYFGNIRFTSEDGKSSHNMTQALWKSKVDYTNKKVELYYYWEGNLPKIQGIKVVDFEGTSMILNILGSQLTESIEFNILRGEVSTFDYDNDLIILDWGYRVAGDCMDLSDDLTSQLFEADINEAVDENATYTMELTEESYDSSISSNYLVPFKIKDDPVPIHTTKKYTVKNVNTSAEKISGSSSKGSKRTVTPKEGKKVASVKVTDSKGNLIPVTINEDGTYSFIQPASSVNVEVTYKNREITLTIGSTEADVDGERSNLDVSPVIRNDRTMLPIRFVAENLGAKVEWNEKNPNYVVITKGDIKIEITLGSDTMKVNGKEVKLDSVAFAENDRTYLPVRAVSENLNAVVEWNEAKPMEVKIYER